MRIAILGSLVATALGSIFAQAAVAQATQAATKSKQLCPSQKADPPICSYSATNGNCKIEIDRMNPVTPPTIYVRHGCEVTVTVNDPYQFEKLTLDWKSTTTIIPPDTFQTAFTSLSTNLGKVTVIGGVQHFAAVTCEDQPGMCAHAIDISRAQERVEQFVKSKDPLASKTMQDALKSVNDALQPPPGFTDVRQPWTATATWQAQIAATLKAAPPTDADITKMNVEKINLDGDVDALKTAAQTAEDKSMVAILLLNQATLKADIDTITSVSARLSALAVGIENAPLAPLSQGIVGNYTITDKTPDDKNYQSHIWAVQYTNSLQPLAKRIAADTLKSDGVAILGSIADASPKQPIMQITVQFQSPSRVEVSAGLMVPFAPYHSYTKASVATNGVVSDNVVQDTKTYTVVPMALINILAKEWIASNKQRSGFFFTGGVGVNPATTAVEFGAGLTYSYRSLAISALADIGRDTKLGGGFTVGQSLGATSAAATPITSTYWTVKPSIALSVRIPLGGSSSGGASAGK
jgi:hypothetical protein